VRRLFDISLCPAASLSATKFQVSDLETNLKASSQALEEAQAQLAELKAKQKLEIEAAIKFAEKAVAHADTSQTYL
jgi:uncharacterized protein involved in exopolysaccharide biosynthesis